VNILGFDTSTPVSAVCVLRADDETFEHPAAAGRQGTRPAHSADLLPAIADSLRRSGLGWHELDAVGVGVGPGPFTGLRIGVATARALSHARDIELRPVSSLAALAYGIHAPLRLPLIDAGRGEVFGALFEGHDELWPAFAAAPGDVAGRLQREGLDPLAAGNGSVRFADVLEARSVRVAPVRSRAQVVSGLAVCRLAREAAAAPLEAVLPHYQRVPDATPST
jgi:tRNA threonylcarbamoyladenosine biosynthesis protein TsaB